MTAMQAYRAHACGQPGSRLPLPATRIRKAGVVAQQEKGGGPAWANGGLKKNQAGKHRVQVVVQYSGTACVACRRNDMRVDAREYQQQWCGVKYSNRAGLMGRVHGWAGSRRGHAVCQLS